MSDEMTVAIFGYPPVVWQSAIRMIGNPLPGTWIAPRTMPSEAMLYPFSWVTAAPSRRMPMRLTACETV